MNTEKEQGYQGTTETTTTTQETIGADPNATKTATTAPSGFMGFMTSGGGFLIIMMIALFAVMIIPQRKREKKIKAMLDGIKVGDRIRTIGGIYGTVSSVKDNHVTIVVGPDKVKLVFAKNAIATVEDAEVENEMQEPLQ